MPLCFEFENVYGVWVARDSEQVGLLAEGHSIDHCWICSTPKLVRVYSIRNAKHPNDRPLQSYSTAEIGHISMYSIGGGR